MTDSNPDLLWNKLEEGIHSVNSGDFTIARELLNPYIHVGLVEYGTHEPLNYALYTLRYFHYYGDELLDSQKFSKGITNTGVLSHLLNKIREINPESYSELLFYWGKKREEFTEQIMHAVTEMQTLGLLIKPEKQETTDSKTKSTRTHLDYSHPIPRALAKKYEDLFEIDSIYIILANIVTLLSPGAKFTDDPFENESINGMSVLDGNKIKKSNAVEWLIKKSPYRLSRLIQKSYDGDLRNTFGHNNYRWNEGLLTYIQIDDGKEYKYIDVFEKTRSLAQLIEVLNFEFAIRYFEDVVDSAPVSDLSRMGFLSWIGDREKREITLLQNWSFNRLFKEKIHDLDSVMFYKQPIDFGEELYSIAFNDKALPQYDLKFKVNEEILDELRELCANKEIQINILSVAPPVHPFTNVEKSAFTLNGNEFLVIDELKFTAQPILIE